MIFDVSHYRSQHFVLSFPGISLGWVTNTQQVTTHRLHRQSLDSIVVLGAYCETISSIFFIIFSLLSRYCLVSNSLLPCQIWYSVKAKANYISENSEKMAREQDTLGVQGGQSSLSWGQNDLFMSTRTLFWVPLSWPAAYLTFTPCISHLINPWMCFFKGLTLVLELSELVTISG